MKFLLFLFVLSIGCVFGESSVILKNNIVEVYDSSSFRAIHSISIDIGEDIKIANFSESRNSILFQVKDGSVFEYSITDKKYRRVTKLNFRLSVIKPMSDQAILLGGLDGRVSLLAINDDTQKVMSFIEPNNYKVKKIQVKGSLILVDHQVDRLNPVGFNGDSLLLKDIQNKPKGLIGFKDRVMTSNFEASELGFGKNHIKRTLSEQEIMIRKFNNEARLKTNTSLVSLYNINPKGEFVEILSVPEFTSYSMNKDWSKFVVSSYKDKSTIVVDFKQIVDKKPKISVNEGAYFDSIKKYGSQFVGMNVDKNMLVLLNEYGKPVREYKMTNLIRDFGYAEEGLFIIYEDATFELGRINTRKVLEKTFMGKIGKDIARNPQSRRVGKNVEFLLKNRNKVLIPMPFNCIGAF